MKKKREQKVYNKSNKKNPKFSEKEYQDKMYLEIKKEKLDFIKKTEWKYKLNITNDFQNNFF